MGGTDLDMIERILEGVPVGPHGRASFRSVLSSYEQTLSRNGMSVETDTFFYRLLLKISFLPGDNWWTKLSHVRRVRSDHFRSVTALLRSHSALCADAVSADGDRGPPLLRHAVALEGMESVDSKTPNAETEGGDRKSDRGTDRDGAIFDFANCSGGGRG